jgi:sulfate adenylyltransferase
MHEAESLPALTISSQAAGNAVMMGGGYFTPLDGFMNVADAISVAETMTLTAAACSFPVPVLCLVPDAPPSAMPSASRCAIRTWRASPVLAVMDLSRPSRGQRRADGADDRAGLRHADPEHPGVAAFNSQGRMPLSGQH